MRVTQPNEQLLPAERLRDVDGLPGVVELMQYMLVRDPLRRPAVHDLLHRWGAAQPLE